MARPAVLEVLASLLTQRAEYEVTQLRGEETLGPGVFDCVEGSEVCIKYILRMKSFAASFCGCRLEELRYWSGSHLCLAGGSVWLSH